MTTAIKLYYEFLLAAIEINDVAAKRVLPPKSRAEELFAAEALPKL